MSAAEQERNRARAMRTPNADDALDRLSEIVASHPETDDNDLDNIIALRLAIKPADAIPYAIGSDRWPGLSKLAEEAGEVLQVIGKLIATGGEVSHWDGTDLRVRLTDELADLLAAADFVVARNGLDVEQRRTDKTALFHGWHEAQAAPTSALDAVLALLDAGEPPTGSGCA